jgi:hypothetical protein
MKIVFHKCPWKYEAGTLEEILGDEVIAALEWLEERDRTVYDAGVDNVNGVCEYWIDITNPRIATLFRLKYGC